MKIMNIKKIMMSSMLMLGFLSASAQDVPTKTEYVFNPHWYVQIQPLGVQYTLGEVNFGDLTSFNVQAAVGYQFHHAVGARLAVSAWQSRGGSEYTLNNVTKKFKWAWKYVAPTIDLTFNISDLICGFNPQRVFNFGAYIGAGLNIGFDNKEAGVAAQEIAAFHYTPAVLATTNNTPLSLLWDGTKTRFVAQAGLTGDFRITDNVSFGLEVSANTLNDHYNSKPAGNADWYFNALAGVKIALGKTYTSQEVPDNNVRIVEKVVEKIVEKPVYIEKPDPKKDENVREPLRRDIFFTINSTTIAPSEQQKVQDVIDYMNKYADATVTITGYADKGTGNARINARLGQNRAKTVVNALVKAGISLSRITSDSKGDTVQPFSENDKNRVSICIAE